MFRTRNLLFLFILMVSVTLLGVSACTGDEKAATQANSMSAGRSAGESAGTVTAEQPAISGRIEAGLRVLTFDTARTSQDFTIYRGDYIKPEIAGGGEFTVVIPELGVEQSFPVAEGQRPYIKVPNVGAFAYTIGGLSGVIEAVDYVAANYREVNSTEAAGLIANLEPFILDVRTDQEFRSGHIDGATLVPVQVLKRRLGEITQHKDRPTLVYCRSGNRSTVAARILADAGFRQIINLRKGIKEWAGEQRPVVK